jgi:hypothetical protein
MGHTVLAAINFDEGSVMRRRRITAEDSGLARRAFALHEAGERLMLIAMRLGVTRATAANLIGFGRRLAAGQGERVEWKED